MLTRLTANRAFLEASKDFINFGNFNQLARTETTTLYAVIGGLYVLIPILEKEYSIILKRIEEKEG